MSEVFISYSWDSDEHNDNIVSFTNHLRLKGFDACIDRMLSQNETATNFFKMMHVAMQQHQKVIIVLSEGYKKKADEFQGGVGNEYQMILNDIDSSPKKYILASFAGRNEGIIPFGLRGRDIIDLSRPEEEERLFRKLLDHPEFNFSPVATNKPQLSTRPIKPFSIQEENPKEKALNSNNSVIAKSKEKIIETLQSKHNNAIAALEHIKQDYKTASNNNFWELKNTMGLKKHFASCIKKFEGAVKEMSDISSEIQDKENKDYYRRLQKLLKDGQVIINSTEKLWQKQSIIYNADPKFHVIKSIYYGIKDLARNILGLSEITQISVNSNDKEKPKWDRREKMTLASLMTAIIVLFFGNNICSRFRENYSGKYTQDVTKKERLFRKLVDIEYIKEDLQKSLEFHLSNDSLINENLDGTRMNKLHYELLSLDTTGIEGWNKVNYYNFWMCYYKFKMYYSPSNSETAEFARKVLEYSKIGFQIWNAITSKEYFKKLSTDINSYESEELEKIKKSMENREDLIFKYNELMALGTILLFSDSTNELKSTYKKTVEILGEKYLDCRFLTEDPHICIDKPGRFIVYLKLLSCSKLEPCDPKVSEKRAFIHAKEKLEKIKALN